MSASFQGGGSMRGAMAVRRVRGEFVPDPIDLDANETSHDLLRAVASRGLDLPDAGHEAILVVDEPTG